VITTAKYFQVPVITFQELICIDDLLVEEHAAQNGSWSLNISEECKHSCANLIPNNKIHIYRNHLIFIRCEKLFPTVLYHQAESTESLCSQNKCYHHGIMHAQLGLDTKRDKRNTPCITFPLLLFLKDHTHSLSSLIFPCLILRHGNTYWSDALQVQP